MSERIAARQLSDLELLERIEFAARRVELAAAGDVRRAADVLAGLALEAAARIRQFEARRS